MGVTNSSEAMTPESRAIARSGTFCCARVRTMAIHVASYREATSALKGGGASGDTYSREQAASARRAPPYTVALLVVVDATVGLDEPPDAFAVELVQRVDARPRGERNRVGHLGVWREDHLLVVLRDDTLEVVHEVGTLAVVLHEDATILEVVYLQLRGNRARVDTPRRDVRQVGPGRRRIRVVRLARVVLALDVTVALVGGERAGEVRGGAV